MTLAVPVRSALDARPFWGLFAVAAAVFLLDAAATIWVLGASPNGVEANPVAAGILAAGPPAALALKAAILLQVAVTADVLRRLDAAWAARLLFGATAAVGSWGVASALSVLSAG